MRLTINLFLENLVDGSLLEKNEDKYQLTDIAKTAKYSVILYGLEPGYFNRWLLTGKVQ